MKKLVTLFIVLCTFSTFSQTTRKDLDGSYFHLVGTVYEIDIQSGESKATSDVQIEVYHEGEIFVAFNTASRGIYEFYLPVGHEYQLSFGGKDYVNKKVTVDTRMMPREKKPQKFDLDIGLFRPIEGHEFPLLNESYVMVYYDEELAALAPDLEYTEEKAAKLEKQMKKIRKQMSKMN